jgi:hypothetical protein
VLLQGDEIEIFEVFSVVASEDEQGMAQHDGGVSPSWFGDIGGRRCNLSD